MIGSVNINKKQYSFQELAHFKKYYCTLCKNIRKRYGMIETSILSYDITYLFMIASYEYKFSEKKESCYPTRHITILEGNEDIISLFADLNILSVYFKAIDDIHDQNKFMAKLLKSVLSKAYKKIKINNQLLVIKYERIMKKLFENENNFSNEDYLKSIEDFSLDIANISTINIKTENRIIIQKLLYYIIYMIYLNDTIEDISADYEHNLFNPILLKTEYFRKIDVYNRLKYDLKSIIYSNYTKYTVLINAINIKEKSLLNKLFISIISEETKELLGLRSD